MFGLVEADPVAVAGRAHRRRERAHLDLDLGCSSPSQFQSATRRARPQGAARPDHDPRLIGLDADDVERLLLTANFDSAPLPNGEMDDAAMPAEHPPDKVDDVAGRLGLGPQPFTSRA